MDTNKRIARIVGALYIIGTIAGILSVVLTGSILGDTDHLIKVNENKNQFVTGTLFVLIMGFALAMIPVVVYPIFKKHNKTLALGYVVFRGALETATYVAVAISMLLLIPLSQEYVIAGAQDAFSFRAAGTVLVEASDLISAQILPIIFSLGALMLYYLLYQSKLIPRWLSGWGLAAIILHLVTSFLPMFSLIDSGSTVLTVMNIPIFAQEMVMAVWLIVKGFNSSAIASASTKTDRDAV